MNSPSVFLVQYSEFDRVFNLLQGLEQLLVIFRIDIRDGITDLRIGHQKLPHNIDIVRGKDRIDLSHNPRNILVNVYQPMRLLHSW